MSYISPIHLCPFTDPALAPRPLIVVIDDSATIRKIVEISLGREGYAVQSFPDGVAALHAFHDPMSRLPAIILLDIVLPRLDGFSVARYLQAHPRTTQIPIVMLSRRTGIVDRLKARLAGASEYLTKPITTQVLLAVVEQYAVSPLAQDH